MSKPERDSLGDRMKNYENAFRYHLTGRMPLIIRVDGKAFHTLTRSLDKPFDLDFSDIMLRTAYVLCEELQGVKLAYWQSDEISLLLTDYDRLTSQAWFDKNLQKMVSVSASIATEAFNSALDSVRDSYELKCLPAASKFKGHGLFDSRAFVLPKEETCNYFLWRQQDATRNSINSVGQANFSHKKLHSLNTDQVQDLLFKEKGINWNALPTWQKRGACVIMKEDGQWGVDWEIPVFSQDRSYINSRVYIGEE